MTHTLHRRGLNETNKEFVVLAMSSKDVNRLNSAPKLARILEIFSKHNPVNYGNVAGNSHTAELADLLTKTRDNTVSHAVFETEEDLIGVLRDLKEENLGVSIVVSGLFEQVHKCCCVTGLKPHTVNISLGVFGKKELLPEEKVLEISTMCGHNMISFSLIKHEVQLIKNGVTTAEDAARKIAKSCHCGVFNWKRASKIFSELAEE